MNVTDIDDKVRSF